MAYDEVTGLWYSHGDEPIPKVKPRYRLFTWFRQDETGDFKQIGWACIKYPFPAREQRAYELYTLIPL